MRKIINCGQLTVKGIDFVLSCIKERMDQLNEEVND